MLFHLRVDLEKLYGAENSFDADASNHTILATIGMLSGLDYLAQAYLGRRSTGDKFVKLLTDLAEVDVDGVEALYQLRCGLVHSVSLSAVSRRRVTYSFTLTDDRDGVFLNKEQECCNEVVYRVNFWGLKRCFMRVIDKLKAICEDKGDERARMVFNNVCQLSTEKILKS